MANSPLLTELEVGEGVILSSWEEAPPLDPDGHVVAMTWQDGWAAYYDMLPVGMVVRSNEAMAGWRAAKAAAGASDVDYR